MAKSLKALILTVMMLLLLSGPNAVESTRELSIKVEIQEITGDEDFPYITHIIRPGLILEMEIAGEEDFPYITHRVRPVVIPDKETAGEDDFPNLLI